MPALPDGKGNCGNRGRADHFRQRRSGVCDFVSCGKDDSRDHRAAQKNEWISR